MDRMLNYFYSVFNVADISMFLGFMKVCEYRTTDLHFEALKFYTNNRKTVHPRITKQNDVD